MWFAFCILLIVTSIQASTRDAVDVVDGRIVGGYEVRPHSVPYQIGYFAWRRVGRVWCGGSLIAARWVLTAAHCLQNSAYAQVFIGAHNINKPIEKGEIRLMVSRRRFILHENWDPRSIVNDIALINLPMAIRENDHIQMIRLPSRTEAVQSFEGKILLASGWGLTSDYNTHTSNLLRSVTLSVIPLTECSRFYPLTIRPNHICTSGMSFKSTCLGDSGGPLIANLPTGPTLIGITSFGSRFGCQKGFPSVFTRVGSYIDWISRTTGVALT